MNPFEIAKGAELYAQHLLNKGITGQDGVLWLYDWDAPTGAFYPIKRIVDRWDEYQGGNELVGWRWELQISAERLTAAQLARVARAVNGGRVFEIEDKFASAGYGMPFHKLKIKSMGVRPLDSISLLNGLGGWWEMTQNANTTRLDSSGNGNHLTVSAPGVGRVAGVGEQDSSLGNWAASFASAGSYLTVPTNASWFQPTGTFALAFWLKVSSNPLSNILIAGKLGRFGVRLSSGGVLSVFVTDDIGTEHESYILSGSVPLNEWVFVYATYDRTTGALRIQQNTADYATVTYNGDLAADTSGAFVVGSDPGGLAVFNCAIDSVGLWKRLLTTSEAAAIYNGGFGATYPFLFT